MKKSFKTKKINQTTEQLVQLTKQQNIDEFCTPENLTQPPASHSRTLVYSLIISILFGFFAGLLVLFLFLSGAFSNSNIFSWMDIDSLLPTAQVIIEKNEKVTVVDDDRVSEIDHEKSPVVVGIYTYQTPTKDKDVQKNIYPQDNFLGSGLILTNDGWLVTTNDVVKNQGKYLVVTQDKQTYLVEKTLFDTNLGVVYLKIKAENLPVALLARQENIIDGEKVIVLNGLESINKNLLVSRVVNHEYILNTKLIHETEKYYLFVLLADDLINNSNGAPAFNFNKEVIGLISVYNSRNYLIPAEYFKKSFNQLLDKNQIKATYLGLEYINLSGVISTSYNQAGALIVNIAKDSPLNGLPVAAGDIIIQVNNEVINGKRNLTNLIQQYKAGDKITLTILDKNDNNEKKIDVVLK